MAAGPETKFTQRINKHIPKEIYREKMHNPYRGGTPDVWYSGDKSDLWVEYKFISKEIKRMFKADLSALQIKWLRSRYDEGRNLAVIVGYTGGGYIFTQPDDWEQSHVVDEAPFSTDREISDWITNVCSKVPR